MSQTIDDWFTEQQENFLTAHKNKVAYSVIFPHKHIAKAFILWLVKLKIPYLYLKCGLGVYKIATIGDKND